MEQNDKFIEEIVSYQQTNRHRDQSYHQRENVRLTEVHKRYDHLSSCVYDESDVRRLLNRIFWLHVNSKSLKEMDMLIKNWKRTAIVNKPYTGQRALLDLNHFNIPTINFCLE